MILGTHAFEDSYNPIDEKEFNVLCSQTLSRTVPCITNDYVIDKNLINTSETSWRDVYAENDYRTPEKDYYDADIKTYKYLTDYIDLFTDLNDYVEIIEESNKIEKISWSEKESLAGELTANEKQNILARRTEKLKSSLNELIDEINNLKEND